MKHPTLRRTVLMAAGAAVVAATTGVAAAASMEIHGKVSFDGGAAIPEGLVHIQVEGLAQAALGGGPATVHAESDGKSDTIDFTLSLPADMTQARPLEVVARLERADGWLLARGSAMVMAGAPIQVTLNPAMY